MQSQSTSQCISFHIQEKGKFIKGTLEGKKFIKGIHYSWKFGLQL